MLANKINYVTSLVNNFINASEVKKEINNYCKINNYIKSNIDVIEDYVTSIKTLNKIDSEIFNLDNLDEHAQKLKIVQDKLIKGIPISESDFKWIFTSINGKAKTTRDNWKVYVNQKTEKIINNLENLKGLFDDNIKLSDLQFKLRLIESSWPVNDDTIFELNETINLSKNIINELGLTQDVEDFIKMVMIGTATLDDITPNIMQWLHKNNFSKSISINFIKRRTN